MNNKKLIWIVSGILIVLVAVGCLLFIPSGKKAVLTSGNFSVDSGSLECYVNVKMNEYVSDYTESYGKSYLENIGLDPEKSLKSQESCYEGSWYDYFKGEAVKDLKIRLVYCEAGKKQGIRLTKEELDEETEYLNAHYTGKKDTDSIKKLAEITGLALKYLDEYKGSIEITEDDRQNFIKEHPEEILCVDYGMIEVVENNDFDMAACEGLAKKIKESFDTVGFDKTLDLYKENENVVITEEKTDVKGYRYSSTTQFGAWAFAEGRKAGESTVFRGSSQYSVYFLKKAAYHYDYIIREFAYIKASNTDKERRSDLISFYKEYEKEPTEEEYDALLKKYDLKPLVRDFNAEDIAPDLRKYIYNYENKVGDFNLIENGSELYFIKITADKESYFETTLKKNIVAVAVSRNLAKLQADYPVKEK